METVSVAAVSQSARYESSLALPAYAAADIPRAPSGSISSNPHANSLRVNNPVFANALGQYDPSLLSRHILQSPPGAGSVDETALFVPPSPCKSLVRHSAFDGLVSFFLMFFSNFIIIHEFLGENLYNINTLGLVFF